MLLVRFCLLDILAWMSRNPVQELLRRMENCFKCPASAQPQRTVGVSRTSVSYWRDHVEKVEGRNGTESPNYSARIVYQKRRVRFPLHTPNKEAGAAKAAQIFKFLREHLADLQDLLALFHSKRLSTHPVEGSLDCELPVDTK